jgi:hypothetical protein
LDSQATKIGPLQLGIIVLTILTALIHLYWSPEVPFSPGLILNGVGYIVLLAALYLPISALFRFRNIVRWTLVGYTAVTVVLWVLVGPRVPIAYADKVIELLLVLLLLLEARKPAHSAS